MSELKIFTMNQRCSKFNINQKQNKVNNKKLSYK